MGGAERLEGELGGCRSNLGEKNCHLNGRVAVRVEEDNSQIIRE